MGTWVLSPGVKRSRRDSAPSPPSSTKVMNKWSYTSTPPIRLHSADRDIFTLDLRTFLTTLVSNITIIAFIAKVTTFNRFV